MSYFYGPVPSRRLGISLGVDLIPQKTCSFDCLYCQLGREGRKVVRRFSYIDFNILKKELKEIVKNKLKIDYITISGSGEPTLHKDLDKIIDIIKRISKNKYPVCVITNSSLLYRKNVREELRKADLIIPSLDAASTQTFRKINRPCKDITFNKIVKGLIALRKEYNGKIWLEIMFVGGINDTIAEAEKFKEIIKRVKPDKVQVNIPVRPTDVKIPFVNFKRLKKIKNILSESAEVVSTFREKRRPGKDHRDLEKKILNFLKVRPARHEDFLSSLGANSLDIKNSIDSLVKRKCIKKRPYKGKNYFVRNG